MNAILTGSEMVEALVRRLGSADLVAFKVGVSPAAVSAWRKSGGLSDQSKKQVGRLIVAFDWRSKFIESWMLERTTGVGGADFGLVLEVGLDFDTDRPSNDRSFRTVQKSARPEEARNIAVMFIDWEMITDGDVLVFLRPGDKGTDATFVYVNRDEVNVSFSRREWEPFWPLRPFIPRKGDL